METLLIQINDAKAYQIFEGLENLQIIKVLEKNKLPQKKLSEKYAGKLSKQTTKELQNQVTQSRNEWNNKAI